MMWLPLRATPPSDDLGAQNDGLLSLREAIAMANASADGIVLHGQIITTDPVPLMAAVG